MLLPLPILAYGDNICLLLFYVLETSKVISGRAPTCDSVHAWQLYSAASLRNQAAGTMTCHPTQSHFPDTEPTLPHPDNSKRQARNRQVSILQLSDLPARETDVLLIRPPHLWREQTNYALMVICRSQKPDWENTRKQALKCATRHYLNRTPQGKRKRRSLKNTKHL